MIRIKVSRVEETERLRLLKLMVKLLERIEKEGLSSDQLILDKLDILIKLRKLKTVLEAVK